MSEGKLKDSKIGYTVSNLGRNVVALAAAVVVTSSLLVSPVAFADAPAAPENYEQTSDAWMDSVGEDFLKNQDLLADYVTWLQKDDRYYNDGYVGAVADPDNVKIKLLWKGTSALRLEAIAEGVKRGISTSLESRLYSRTERAEFQDLLSRSDQALRLVGLTQVGLDGISAENSPLTVHGVLAGMAGSDFSTAAAARLASSIVGVPVKVRLAMADVELGEYSGEDPDVDSGRLTGNATRDTDTGPFNAGGLMKSGGLACSSGFAIHARGGDHVTTARHCNNNNPTWYAYDVRNSHTYYGPYFARSSASGGNADLLSDGWGRVFDGAAVQRDGYYKRVVDWKDYSIGMSVCGSGGMSGVHCGLKISQTDYSNGSFLSFIVKATGSNAIAGATGDSGGPVFVPISGTDNVHATGMIQLAPGGTTVTCTGTKTSTVCTSEMGYTTVHTILDNWNATLVTRTS